MSEPFNPTALQQLAQLRGMRPEEAALAVAIPEDTVLVLDVHAGRPPNQPSRSARSGQKRHRPGAHG